MDPTLADATIVPEYRLVAVGGRRWARVRCRPTAVIVNRPDACRRIAIPDPTRRALRVLLLVSVAAHLAAGLLKWRARHAA